MNNDTQHKPLGRVLILVENLPVPFDRRVWMEANSLHAAGYEVNVICPKGKGYDKGFERIDGIYVYRYSLPIEASGFAGYLFEYPVALICSFVLALRVAFARGIDVIHACNPPDLLFLVAAPFKLFGCRFIFDHHDLCPELLDSKYDKPRPFLRALMVLFERLTFAMSNVSIATNESYKRVAVSRGKMKPENVYVVRSGPRRAWIDRAATSDSAEKLVGYVGVMGAQEGLDLLLEAAHHLVYIMKRDDVRFVLVGDGSARRDLEAQAAALSLSDHVRFTGRVSDAELKDWLGRSAVLVNPDRPSELNDKSTMNKIVEYMAMAKPIVQFECTEGRFSAQDASLYAKPNDVQDFAAKIAQLLDDPALARQLGEYGRARFESDLCWEHQEPKLLAAYAAALGRAPARDAAFASSTSA